MFGCDLKTRLLWTLLAGSCAMGAPSVQGQDNRFQQWDKNKDGQLVIEELPQQLRPNFKRVDRNQDGFISQDEHNRFIRRDRPPTDQQRQDKTYESHLDIAYVANGHRRQKLDLYLPIPKSGKPLPLVIFVHGGGWKGGDKSSAPVREFLNAGFAVASVNYRLSQHATFPGSNQRLQNGRQMATNQRRPIQPQPQSVRRIWKICWRPPGLPAGNHWRQG